MCIAVALRTMPLSDVHPPVLIDLPTEQMPRNLEVPDSQTSALHGLVPVPRVTACYSTKRSQQRANHQPRQCPSYTRPPFVQKGAMLQLQSCPIEPTSPPPKTPSCLPSSSPASAVSEMSRMVPLRVEPSPSQPFQSQFRSHPSRRSPISSKHRSGPLPFSFFAGFHSRLLEPTTLVPPRKGKPLDDPHGPPLLQQRGIFHAASAIAAAPPWGPLDGSRRRRKEQARHNKHEVDWKTLPCSRACSARFPVITMLPATAAAAVYV